jgi:L-gulonolactone oxidase
MTSGATAWHNWSRRVHARPVRVVQPSSTEEVARTVEEAARAGLPLKAVGSGHSFSEIAVADGAQLRLDRMDRLLALDAATGLVTVQAGIALHGLNPLLAAAGLAMTNLGDIDRQTIAGATSTGTHGTGASFGGISTQIRAMRLVLADGTCVRCAADERPDLFAAARVGLGALGIVTEVTLQCEPLFVLHTRERPMPVEQTLEELPGLVDQYDHFEFFWFPHTSTALTKSGTRLPGDAERRPIGKVHNLLVNEVLANGVFGLALRAGAKMPRTIPGVTRVATAGYSAAETIDYSYRVFPSHRAVRFNESEFAVPRAVVVDVLREMKRWVDGHDERVAFPFEVRFAAPDDIWLSTAYQRESAYIAFHQYHRLPYRRFFEAMEAIVRDADGRPHWGKMHDLGAADLRPRYPRFDDFVAMRDEVDPTGVFGNAYLDRVLGPPPGSSRSAG